MQTTTRPSVEVFDTHTRGFGLRVSHVVSQDTILIDYIGVYTPVQTHRTTLRNDAPIYGMETGTGYVIDATKYGNCARFVNHACEPNTRAEKWFINKIPKVILISNRTLQANEEITIDYGVAATTNPSFNCLCGAKTCRSAIE